MYMRGAQLGELTFLYHLEETVLWHTLTSCRAFNTNTYHVELIRWCIVPVQDGMPANAVPVVLLGVSHVSHVSHVLHVLSALTNLYWLCGCAHRQSNFVTDIVTSWLLWPVRNALLAHLKPDRDYLFA